MRNFDFNSVQQPTMGITLPNEERTRLTLTVPKTSLVERLSANAKEMQAIFRGKDVRAVQEVYKLIADVLSCNQENRTVTAEELKECLTVDHVTAFLLAYMEFLTEIKQAKN